MEEVKYLTFVEQKLTPPQKNESISTQEDQNQNKTTIKNKSDKNNQKTNNNTDKVINRKQVKYFYTFLPHSNFAKHLKREWGLEETKNKYQKETISIVLKYEKRRRFHSQMMIRIQGATLMGDKDLFKNALLDYDQKQRFTYYNSTYFNPLQFNVYFDKVNELMEDEKNILLEKLQGIYILKPALGLQGKGISVVHNMTKLELDIKAKANGQNLTYYIYNETCNLQKYIENPLTLNKKKVDYRSFFSIVSNDPLIVLHHTGYARRSMVDFDLFDEDNQFVHNVNRNIQEQHSNFTKDSSEYMNLLFSEYKFEILKEYPQFTEYDFLELEDKMKAAVTYSILSTKHNFQKIKGDIEILAVDWLIDDELNPYVIEINNGPYFSPKERVRVLDIVLPDILADYLDAGLNLNVMSKEDIINNSIKDPEFICQYAYRTKCELLINEGANFNFLEDQKEKIQHWKPLKMKSASRGTIKKQLEKRKTKNKKI